MLTMRYIPIRRSTGIASAAVFREACASRNPFRDPFRTRDSILNVRHQCIYRKQVPTLLFTFRDECLFSSASLFHRHTLCNLILLDESPGRQDRNPLVVASSEKLEMKL